MEEFLFPGAAPVPAPSAVPTDPTYVLVVSGLDVGRASIPLAMLVDFITGNLGDDEDIKLASRISRVIVAGNLRTEVPQTLLASQKLSKEAQDRIHGARVRFNCVTTLISSTYLCQGRCAN